MITRKKVNSVGIAKASVGGGVTTLSNSPYNYNHEVGLLSNLTTEDKANLVSAINEIKEEELTKSQITNCILEAPRMVDLELTDNNLILKAGSRLILPYGTSAPTYKIGDYINSYRIVDISFGGSQAKRLFYILETPTDMLASNIFSSATRYCYASRSGNYINRLTSNGLHSGSSPGSANQQLWYDTTNNIIKYRDNSSSDWTLYYSLPFAIIEDTASVGITAIKQIFQYMGAMGSIVWYTKGITVLAGDGRNIDGTLNNQINTSTHIEIIPVLVSNITIKLFIGKGKVNPSAYLNIWEQSCLEQEATPTNLESGRYYCWYNPVENVFSLRPTNNKWEMNRPFALIGTYTTDSNLKVSSLTPEYPVRLAQA